MEDARWGRWRSNILETKWNGLMVTVRLFMIVIVAVVVIVITTFYRNFSPDCLLYLIKLIITRYVYSW